MTSSSLTVAACLFAAVACSPKDDGNGVRSPAALGADAGAGVDAAPGEAPTWPHAPRAIGAFTANGESATGWPITLCMDDTGGVVQDGNPAQLWDCNGTAAQSWIYTASGEIQGPGGKCLDVAGGSASDGAAIELEDCDGSDTQHWIWDMNGTTFTSVASQYQECIGFGGARLTMASGDPLVLSSCSVGSFHTISWSIGLVSGGLGTITVSLLNNTGASTNMCLDDNDAGTSDGNKIQLWSCNGTAAQTWTYTEAGQFIGPGGKCLDATNASMADGTAVQLWDCNGTAAQAWVWDANGNVIWPLLGEGGQCVDAQGGATSDGTQIQIWHCDGTAAQWWVQATATGSPCGLPDVVCYQGQDEWQNGQLACVDNGPNVGVHAPDGTQCGPDGFYQCHDGACVESCPGVAGASCDSNDDCCHGMCESGACAQCVAPGGACAGPTQCCTGTCPVAEGELYSHCACTQAGQPCFADSECCDGACDQTGPNANGTGYVNVCN